MSLRKGTDIGSRLWCRPVKDVLCFGRISFNTHNKDIMIQEINRVAKKEYLLGQAV